MNIDYKWTDGRNEDFQKFYLKTEEFYSSIVGGLKNRAAFVPYNISESITDVLIASVDGVAVGCAGLKAYSDSDVEIKRVWVDPEFRGNHISTVMMDELEKRPQNSDSNARSSRQDRRWKRPSIYTQSEDTC